MTPVSLSVVVRNLFPLEVLSYENTSLKRTDSLHRTTSHNCQPSITTETVYETLKLIQWSELICNTEIDISTPLIGNQ